MTLLRRLLLRLARLPLIGLPVQNLLAWLASRALAGPARRLEEGLPLLPQATEKLERCYLDLSKSLERLARVASDLVGGARQVVAMASGKDTGETDFQHAFNALAAPMDYVSLALAELPQVADALESAAAEAGRLVALEQALDQALAPLRFTQMMFSVESASLSEADRESFGAVTSEIGALHQRVQVSLRQHFEALIETRKSLCKALSELERYSAERGPEVGRRRRQVAEAVEGLQKEIQKTSRRDVRLTSTTEALAAEVNRAVVALQTQDIVAQKLDHARRGLSDLLLFHT